MTETDNPTDLFDRLTEREVAILRLLASGHTAKTIAVQLDCSEASVNERLRDARRKTGVGSSRELARMLSTRKNWDENFGLSALVAADDRAAHPAPSGSGKLKGIAIMLVIISAMAAAVTFVATDGLHGPAGPATEAAAGLQKSPLVGTWALDVARIPADERPRRVTITFRAAPDHQWTTIVDIDAADGSRKHAESTAQIDGTAVPVTGNMAMIDNAALRQPGPNTLVMALGKNGAPVSTRVYTVSKDRKSMTETIIWPGEHLPKLETTYYHRIS